jgi:hypothetical protein
MKIRVDHMKLKLALEKLIKLVKNQLIKYLTTNRPLTAISLFFTYISLTKYIISTIIQIIALVIFFMHHDSW